jgi:FKBP-type peptidyl-prolyl cis-trans isomerase FkpA
LKKITGLLSLLLATVVTQAQQKRVEMPYNLPDSIKAVSIIATVQLTAVKGKAKSSAGISANDMSLYIKTFGSKYRVYFDFPPGSVEGFGITGNSKGMAWDFEITAPAACQLLLASASDSAENFTLYSGYIYLPAIQKWKLVATYKVPNQWTTLKNLSSFYTAPPKSTSYLQPANTWCQRNTGSWKALVPTDAMPPVLPPFSNMDSAR